MDPSSESRAEHSKSLQLYAKQVGASATDLQEFADSLWAPGATTLRTNCLGLFADDARSRGEFLRCLIQQGQGFYSKHFIEQIVPMRLFRLKNIHDPINGTEYRRSLRLLNWIYDLALEQYSLSDPKSFWLERRDDDTWAFKEKDTRHPEWNMQNRADYDFHDGDVSLNIASEYFSTIIPQFTYPERRLTHMWVYRGDRQGQDAHMIEALLGEGVWPTYTDTFRKQGEYYEQYMLRYNDPHKTRAQNAEVRARAADASESKIGSEYNFSGDDRRGFFCTFLGSFSFASVLLDLDGLVGPPLFNRVSKLFPLGYTPLRKGPSRLYAARFGVDPDQESFPSAGDFFTVENFDTLGYYFQPKLSRQFSDNYAFSESFIDAVDRGSTIKVPQKLLDLMDPMTKDREMIKGLIGYVRKIHSKSLFRNKLVEQKVSLKYLEMKTPAEFDAILDRLDEERKVLQQAAVDNITSLRIWRHVFTPVPDVNNPNRMMPPTEFFQKVRDNDGRGLTTKDFEQLHKFIDAVDLEGVNTLLEEVMTKMPVMGTLIPIVRWNRDRGIYSTKETLEYEDLLRNYAMLLLSVPTLKEKVAELRAKVANDARDKIKAERNPFERAKMQKDLDSGATVNESLTNLFKLTPFLASDLPVDTIQQFVVLEMLGGKVVDGFQELRDKLGLKYLWQTPPWVQRDSFEWIIREKAGEVVKYK